MAVKRKLIPFFVVLALVMGPSALYLFLDYEGRLPWNRGEEPANLRVRPAPEEARRRAQLMRRRWQVLKEIDERSASGIPDEKARSLEARACALFGEGDYEGVERAFDAALAALKAPPPKSPADGRAPERPMSDEERARRKAELQERFDRARSQLEGHGKESIAKDTLFDALGDAFTLLDAGNLRDAEAKIDEVEYGLPNLPR